MERIENAALGRAVLNVVDGDPKHFSMEMWAYANSCDTVACLGGWALLKSGYRIVSTESGRMFIRPDGTVIRGVDVEAARVLGMTISRDHIPGIEVFYDFEHGVDRFRKMVEEAEGRG